MKINTCFRVVVTGLRFFILKLFYKNHFMSTLLNSCQSDLTIELDRKSKIFIKKHMASNRGLVLSVKKGGVLKIGSGVNFNRDCQIICRGKTSIGDDVIFGPGCKLYDHDHDYHKFGKERRYSTIIGNVTIGNGVWFGANCVILKGTEIGDNCVFGAGSIVKGTYKPNSVIIQKRIEIYGNIPSV